MLEFRSPGNTTKPEREKKETITINKKAKVTTILFPDNYTQDKGSRSFFTEIKKEDGNLLYAFVQWEEGMPDTNKVGKYNVGENSVNSAPIAKVMQELFDTEKEEFECSVEEMGGYKLLIVLKPKENVLEAPVKDVIVDFVPTPYEESYMENTLEPEEGDLNKTGVIINKEFSQF